MLNSTQKYLSKSCALLALTLLCAVMVTCTQSDPASASASASESASTPHDDELAGRLTVTGSSTMAPLVNEIAKRFEIAHPNVRIDVQTGGSSRGLADVQRGTADIGMSSRALHALEMIHADTTLLANDGVCFIINRDNPVTTLTAAQIIDIYLGHLHNWSEVGGAHAPITVVHRADGRSEVELVLAHFNLDGAQIKPDVIAGENQQGIKLIASDVNAITFMSVGTAEFEVKSGTPIRMLPLDNVPASVSNVANGSFPLRRPLVLVTPRPRRALTDAFIAFATSDTVDDLVRKHSFVTLQR
jgi:phosphate transport system substrate-binding protein